MGYGRQVVIKETDKKPEKQAERERVKRCGDSD